MISSDFSPKTRIRIRIRPRSKFRKSLSRTHSSIRRQIIKPKQKRRTRLIRLLWNSRRKRKKNKNLLSKSKPNNKIQMIYIKTYRCPHQEVVLNNSTIKANSILKTNSKLKNSTRNSSTHNNLTSGINNRTTTSSKLPMRVPLNSISMVKSKMPTPEPHISSSNTINNITEELSKLSSLSAKKLSANPMDTPTTLAGPLS